MGSQKFPPHGNNRIRAAIAAEHDRVQRILQNDRAHRYEEDLRRAANVEVAAGKFANLADTAERPTPEQLGQAERAGAGFARFVPRGEEGTVRTIIAYRRRDVPQAHKMLLAGVIDYGGLKACIWYRNLYEMTGLEGNVRGSDYGREVFVLPHQREVFTSSQLDAQDDFRAVRPLIKPRHLRLLDLMVLEDVPIFRAVRAARAFHRKAKAAFGDAVTQLEDAREMIQGD